MGKLGAVLEVKYCCGVMYAMLCCDSGPLYSLVPGPSLPVACSYRGRRVVIPDFTRGEERRSYK